MSNEEQNKEAESQRQNRIGNTQEVKPLSEVASGGRAVVRQLCGGQGFTSRMAALGFSLGVDVTVVQNYGRGPMIVNVRETHVALGRGEATKVLVQVSG